MNEMNNQSNPYQEYKNAKEYVSSKELEIRRSESNIFRIFIFWTLAWVSQIIGYYLFMLGQKVQRSHELSFIACFLFGIFLFTALPGILYLVALLHTKFAHLKNFFEIMPPAGLFFLAYPGARFIFFISILDEVGKFGIWHSVGPYQDIKFPPDSLFLTALSCMVIAEMPLLLGYAYCVHAPHRVSLLTELQNRKDALYEAKERLSSHKQDLASRQVRIQELREQKPISAEEFAQRGANFLDEGLVQEALVNLDAALILDPDNAKARIWKGKAQGIPKDESG